MYHSINLNSTNNLIITPQEFEKQVKWLKDNEFTPLFLEELYSMLTTGKNIPSKPVALTFDDGYQSLYTEAFPVLQQYGFSATVFLIAGYCGKDNQWPGQPSFIPAMNLLTWEQIDEMARYGIEFGSHTFHHPRLDNLPAGALYDEIVLPKLVLEGRLGRPVTVFAYPYGRYTDLVKDMVKSSYEAACSTQPGLARPVSDRYGLERVEIKYLSHPWVFQQLFHRVFPFYLAARRAGRFAGSAIFPRAWR